MKHEFENSLCVSNNQKLKTKNSCSKTIIITNTNKNLKNKKSLRINFNKSSIINFLLIFIISLNFIKPTIQKNFTNEDCIAENNKNFDFYKPYSRLINNPSQCTEKSSTCCYIEVNYDYAGHIVDNTFCVLLGGDVNVRIHQITGILTDQIRYYSDFIYNNYEMITSIGQNLDYVFHENYTCYERAQEIDFFYYVEDNCAVTNSDGTCKIVNDFTYKDNYLTLLYDNITSNFCNNRDPLGNCVYYNDSPNYNVTGLSPLLDYLKVSLNLYENSTDLYELPVDDPVEIKKNNTELSKKFYKKCKQIIPAKVKIVCPSSYIEGYFFGFKKQNFYTMIVLFFIFF